MPKMDGLQLAEAVRQRYPRCKIVFLSGYAEKHYLKKAISLQAVSYIEKPVDPAEVRQVTRAAVDLLREEAERREETERIRAAALDGESLVRERIVRSLVEGAADPEALRRTYGSAVPSLPPGSCCTACVLSLCWGRDLPAGRKEALRGQILRAGRTIRITGGRQGGALCLQIRDDGVGMPAERARDMLCAHPAGENPHGYGVRNIHERLRFGPGFGLEFRSVQGSGATVTVRVPAA